MSFKPHIAAVVHHYAKMPPDQRKQEIADICAVAAHINRCLAAARRAEKQDKKGK